MNALYCSCKQRQGYLRLPIDSFLIGIPQLIHSLVTILLFSFYLLSNARSSIVTRAISNIKIEICCAVIIPYMLSAQNELQKLPFVAKQILQICNAPQAALPMHECTMVCIHNLAQLHDLRRLAFHENMSR